MSRLHVAAIVKVLQRHPMHRASLAQLAKQHGVPVEAHHTAETIWLSVNRILDEGDRQSIYFTKTIESLREEMDEEQRGLAVAEEWTHKRCVNYLQSIAPASSSGRGPSFSHASSIAVAGSSISDILDHSQATAPPQTPTAPAAELHDDDDNGANSDDDTPPKPVSNGDDDEAESATPVSSNARASPTLPPQRHSTRIKEATAQKKDAAPSPLPSSGTSAIASKKRRSTAGGTESKEAKDDREENAQAVGEMDHCDLLLAFKKYKDTKAFYQPPMTKEQVNFKIQSVDAKAGSMYRIKMADAKVVQAVANNMVKDPEVVKQMEETIKRMFKKVSLTYLSDLVNSLVTPLVLLCINGGTGAAPPVDCDQDGDAIITELLNKDDSIPVDEITPPPAIWYCIEPSAANILLYRRFFRDKFGENEPSGLQYSEDGTNRKIRQPLNNVVELMDAGIKVLWTIQRTGDYIHLHRSPIHGLFKPVGMVSGSINSVTSHDLISIDKNLQWWYDQATSLQLYSPSGPPGSPFVQRDGYITPHDRDSWLAAYWYAHYTGRDHLDHMLVTLARALDDGIKLCQATIDLLAKCQDRVLELDKKSGKKKKQPYHKLWLHLIGAKGFVPSANAPQVRTNIEKQCLPKKCEKWWQQTQRWEDVDVDQFDTERKRHLVDCSEKRDKIGMAGHKNKYHHCQPATAERRLKPRKRKEEKARFSGKSFPFLDAATDDDVKQAMKAGGYVHQCVGATHPRVERKVAAGESKGEEAGGDDNKEQVGADTRMLDNSVEHSMLGGLNRYDRHAANSHGVFSYTGGVCAIAKGISSQRWCYIHIFAHRETMVRFFVCSLQHQFNSDSIRVELLLPVLIFLFIFGLLFQYRLQPVVIGRLVMLMSISSA